jgi:4-hydroxybenzoate polyprenyltransferase
VIAFLKLFRFPLVFTAIADSAAGYLVVGRSADLFILALLAVTSAGLYCFGMAMNDIADRDRDREIAPNRVLPSGRITLRGAVAASVVAALGSATAFTLVRQGPPLRFGVWAGVFLAILAYDFVLKVPPVMGLVRAGNFLLGALSADPIRFPMGSMGTAVGFDYGPIYALALAPLVYGTALTWVSTLEEGQVRRPVVLLGALVMAMGALVPLVVHSAWYFHRALWGLVPAGVLVGWTFCRASRARDRRGIMLLVRDGVAGFILLDATQLAARGLLVQAAGVAALLVPAALSVAGFKRLP